MSEPERIGSGLDAVIRKCELALEQHVWPNEERDAQEALRRAERAEQVDLHEFARSCLEGSHRSDAAKLAKLFWTGREMNLLNLRLFKREALRVERGQAMREADERRARK